MSNYIIYLFIIFINLLIVVFNLQWGNTLQKVKFNVYLINLSIYYIHFIILFITLVHNGGTNGRTANYHLYILEDLQKPVVDLVVD